MKTHQYHLVDPSPWPFLASLGAFLLTLGGVFYMHEISAGNYMMPAGLALVLYTMYVWWRDVVKEAAVDKAHTEPVKKGLKIGMSLFIISEIMFFFAFFFAFFHSKIFPADIFTGEFPLIKGIWPPEGVKTLDPWDVPF